MSGVLVTYLQEMEARKNPYKKAARSGGKNRGNLGRNQAPKLHDLPTVPKKIIKGKYKIKLSRRKGRVTTGVDSKQPIFLSTKILIPICTYSTYNCFQKYLVS